MKDGQTSQEDIRRAQLREDLRQACEQSLDERVDRYLEISHQGIISNRHFAGASSECIMLYRDGYFISAVMTSQAVNEGILKFVAERNGIPREEHDKLVEKLKAKKVISAECAAASTDIWRGFRNDVHHMNPTVIKIPFRQLAKQNLQNLALIEKEIFDVEFENGNLVPKQPKYWDIQNDATILAFLRLGV